MKKFIFILMTFSFLMTNAQTEEKNEVKNFDRWQVRLRGIGVFPYEKAKIGVIAGGIDISDTFVPELDFSYFFTKHISAELILATTKHNVHTVGSNISAVGGSTSANVDLGNVWLLPPTLTAQYHFTPLDEKAFKPYVGAGLNYTLFYNEDAGNTIKGISYENKLGYAVQLGFDLMLNDTYFLNFDAKKIFLKTQVTVDASNLATNLSIPADVTIDPLVLGFGIGMKF